MASACNLIKKETLAQVCSCEFCEISKNTFFTEHLRAAASKYDENYNSIVPLLWKVCRRRSKLLWFKCTKVSIFGGINTSFELKYYTLLNKKKRIYRSFFTYLFLWITFFLRIPWRLIFAIVIRCFGLRLWEGYFIYFKFTPVFF